MFSVLKVILKKGEDKRLKKGHLWIFSNEIQMVTGHPANGDLVYVYDFKNQLLGSGFYNQNSLIAVRMISTSAIDDLQNLFSKLIDSAYRLRKSLYPNRNSFRMVFSESDFLPGLIIDKYNNTFVLQVNSFGMQKNIGIIIDILIRNYEAENIFTKNDFYLRKLEGLPEENEILLGQTSVEVIDDGIIKYEIDFKHSQKTGFYFDQSDNRYFIEKIIKDKTAADIFCNCGGFGLHALKVGAKSVDFVDSSSNEIENVKANLKLNGLNQDLKIFASDAFDFINEAIRSGKKYDVVMIDPPAFAKNKKSLPTAEKGYEKLNRLAFQIIEEGGFLATSSCSYHLKKQIFLDCINKAALKSNKMIQMIHFNEASLDHPKLTAMEETSYLKFAVFRVL